MPNRAATLLLALALAACGGPTASSSAPPSATRVPTAEPLPLANPADAFVVTVGRTAGGTPTDTITVEAVSPDGVHLPIATIRDAAAGLPPGTRVAESEPMVVGPRGHLALVAEVEDAVETLIFDLRDPSRAPFAIRADGRLGFGPAGRLVLARGTTTTFVDPVRGESLFVDAPGSAVWAADGSGVLGTQPGPAGASIAGVLRPDGSFVAGVAEPWSMTGIGRPYGANGFGVGDARSSGPLGSDHAIVSTVGPDSDALLVWLVVTTPGSDPSILSYAWDAAGRGVWVVLGRDGEATLAHLPAPGERDDRVTFPLTGRPTIVGVAADDGALVVAVEAAVQGDEARLLRIDPTDGRIVRIDRGDDGSHFAGWAQAR